MCVCVYKLIGYGAANTVLSYHGGGLKSDASAQLINPAPLSLRSKGDLVRLSTLTEEARRGLRPDPAVSHYLCYDQSAVLHVKLEAKMHHNATRRAT